jgi:uncharacterized SAM-binding protein YcdF (DUF218 family)
MIWFKVIQQFLTPSVFIPLIILLGFILLLRKKKSGVALLILGLTLYYLFSITPLADAIIAPLENQFTALKEPLPQEITQAVILLGGPESDRLRATEAVRIANLQPETEIIISGQYFLDPENTQAQKLKNHLISQGIDSSKIILENKSRTTGESAQNLQELLENQCFYLITSAYHLPRSALLFSQKGLSPFPVPADFKIQKNKYDLLDFFPCSQNLRNVDLAFHEYLGLIYAQITN